jgi:hypothetical protein
LTSHFLPDSPSSRALQDQLQSATKALEELKEAVRQRRLIKKHSHLTDNLACIGTDGECLQHSAGLGLRLLMDDLQSKLIRNPQVASHTEVISPRAPSELPVRRHWLTDDTHKPCNSTSKPWHSSADIDKQILSPQTVASPTMMSAPPTPSLESGSFSTAATPVMPSSTFTASNSTQQQGHSESSSFASHHNNNATAIAAVGAIGGLLILAALLIAIYFRKTRSKQHQNKMDSVLDKVVSQPNPYGDTEKQDAAAIGSQEYFAAASHKDNFTSDTPECRTVPPWLTLNMGSHPFASATPKPERFSHDLLDSGLVGEQRPIKDYSFNWNFPKLSVPPAAARAISSGHYVKKRATVGPSIPSNQPERVKPVSASSSTTRRCSSVRDNMSQSASSECVDPEIDHRRKSFAILEVSSKPLVGWIKSAFRHLTPTQTQSQQQSDRDIEWIDDSSISTPWIPSISSRISGRQSSEDRSLSLSMQKSNTSLAYYAPDSLALTQAVVEQVMEIRLPSLSIANSPMLDIKDAPSPMSSIKQAARRSSLQWTKDVTPVSQPQRSLSSGSDGSIATKFHRGSTSRRVSWAGPLESCREDSKESVLHLSRSADSASKMTNAQRSQMWNMNSDITDTDDETREGYEAEEEGMDTELENDNNFLPSTPVITLTCSEEEGRFERQISLNSVYRSATSSEDHSKLEEQKEVLPTLKHSFQSHVDNNDDSDDDDGATIIVHSSGSAEDNSSDTDSCHSGALHSLLVDDFPTIPEWTPIPASLRNPHQ